MESEVVMGIVLTFGMCVIVPLGFIGGLVYFLTRRARTRHEERMAMIARGMVPADATPPSPPQPAPLPRGSDSAVYLGWCVGIVVAGVLLLVRSLTPLSLPGIAITAVGAGFLTRGIAGLKRAAGKSPSNGENR